MTRYKQMAFLLIGLLWVGSASTQMVEVPDTNLREAIRETLRLPVGASLTRQEMELLQELDAPRRDIEDLTGLEHAKNLEYLYVWRNPISDLSPLGNLTRLRNLNAGNCQILDAVPLANLINLEYLSLASNKIVDVSPLANLTQLKKLWLNENRIVDVSPLANLTRLKGLWITDNRIIDHSPLFGLSLTEFEWDEPCVLPSLPAESRIKDRTFPSVFAAWGDVGWSPVENLPELSDREQIALHDFYWSIPYAGQHFFKTANGWRVTGYLSRAQEYRDAYLDWNPNMIFIAEVRIRDANINTYGEDFPYWLRDSGGNLIYDPELDSYFTNFTQPGMQEIIIQQAVAVAKCGLYDGIFFDWFAERGRALVDSQGIPFYSYEEEQQAKDKILRGIRAAVRDDFLIIINTARYKIPRRAWGINGIFMETIQDRNPLDDSIEGDPYNYEGLKEIESTLTWAEENLREPRVNCLEGWGTPHEPPDSPRNKRFMRVFTTMSLTHSDGYVLYGMNNTHQHIWHSFWDADLGRPVGMKAQRYQNIDGLFIREFTNGWAVYNRSGKTQAITLPRVSTGVSSDKQDITHLLPDLDGEIYLRKGKPFDLNADGTINVLDLIIVSQAFGTIEGDINGDGTTNVLDLILVAQQFE